MCDYATEITKLQKADEQRDIRENPYKYLQKIEYKLYHLGIEINGLRNELREIMKVFKLEEPEECKEPEVKWFYGVYNNN